MKVVSVLGMGYIGLPLAALLARRGFQVRGVDVAKQVVDTINSGGVHIVEPHLDKAVKQAVSSGNLQADIQPRISDIFIVCVPTPFFFEKDIPVPVLDYVSEAIDNIIPVLEPGNLIVIESTCPVGTTEAIGQKLSKAGLDLNAIHLAYCPERVLPGNIFEELTKNDRVVGGYTEAAAKLAAKFYENITSGSIFITDSKTAEMCKLTENSFRDVNIAFANELSMICDDEGIDVRVLTDLANRHPRVNILRAGPGVGGHCIAVDPWFIVSRNFQKSQIIKAAREVNIKKTFWVVDKIIEKVHSIVGSKNMRGFRIFCLGLTYKPDIDDVRESPAVVVVTQLINQGFDVCVVEPNVEYFDGVECVKNIPREVIEESVVAILVNHREFKTSESRQLLAKADTLDFCGALSL